MYGGFNGGGGFDWGGSAKRSVDTYYAYKQTGGGGGNNNGSGRSGCLTCLVAVFMLAWVFSKLVL